MVLNAAFTPKKGYQSVFIVVLLSVVTEALWTMEDSFVSVVVRQLGGYWCSGRKVTRCKSALSCEFGVLCS